ncbi:hypothetical protein Q5427_11460 [Brochothrix thermosphacta]|uniref:hypothetical protein n=1 Tax=Brochothrix thermosphacta TaxID=2756 RepID=UPI0027136421|nr:hypothetical protein [Brochothrix thermosphacta]MDO7864907.1 hypothetical protein [Brochothrix thermosphacta]
MVEKIYNLVEILDRDVVKNGDGVTPFQFKLSYSDGKTVDLKDKRVYVSFASTTTYLFKKKADVDKDGVISITLSDDDPIIEGNTEIEISVESSNGKSQKFPSQDGEHSAFVYISKSIESLNSRLISTYTLKQFSDKIDILMDDLEKKYDDHLNNLKKDVGDYIDNSVEDKVDEIKAVAKKSMDASIKASKDSIAASLTAENNVKATSTKAVADINSTATKATTDVNKAANDATKKITDTSNTAVATVNAKGDEVLKNLTGGDLVQKKDYYPLISGTGTRERLADGTDLLTLKTGYYEVAQCKNSPFPDTEASWKNIDVIDGGAGRKMLRLTVSSKGDTFYKTLHTNSAGGRDWWQVANTSDLQLLVKSSEAELWQKQKITKDDGSSIMLTDYDLLNTTNVSNFDGYSNVAINMPNGVSPAGYIKRKYRGGYIEITYSPYNLNTVYRNSYNPTTEAWSGWVQFANQTDVTALKGTDTGWITYNTLNGVLANASFTDPSENGYKCAYRKITANGVTRLLLRVNISNITAESVIFANLPKGIVVNSQSGVARTNKANQKVVVVLRPSGELSINVPTGFSEKGYTYNQFDWTF